MLLTDLSSQRSVSASPSPSPRPTFYRKPLPGLPGIFDTRPELPFISDQEVSSQEYLRPGYDHDAAYPHEARPQPSRQSSEAGMVPIESRNRSFTFQKYSVRSLLTVLGPLFILTFYGFILGFYLLNPAVNGIVSNRPLDARGVFFTWLVITVFVADINKIGLAGIEAAAFMRARLAPSNPHQLLWHADRGWSLLDEWVKSIRWMFTRMGKSSVVHGQPIVGHIGPSLLWWYLAICSIIFYTSVPLAGLSMDPGKAFKITDRPITIYGQNETTFNYQQSIGIATELNARWRQTNPTTPQGSAILYAPKGTPNVSATFFEDTIQKIYAQDKAGDDSVDHLVTFFSGPTVSERAHGTAWGLLTNLSCSAVNPMTGLEVIQLSSINDWTTNTITMGFPSVSRSKSMSNITVYEQLQEMAGLSESIFSYGSGWGVGFQYIMAGTADIGYLGANFTDASQLPLQTSLELVMWQTNTTYTESNTVFQTMQNSPHVVSSVDNGWVSNGSMYLGFGVKCDISNDVGYVDIDARTRTYSNFVSHPAQYPKVDLGSLSLQQYPGLMPLDALVYSGFTTSSLGFMAAPICPTNGGNPTCNSWYGANVATGGTPTVPDLNKVNSLSMPAISPERMTLAMYKIFGEAAIAVMSSGPGNWTGQLRGLDPTNDLVNGRVPWQIVSVLLIIWAVMVIAPTLWMFNDERFAKSLGGFEMFRLGTTWRHAENNDFSLHAFATELPKKLVTRDSAKQNVFDGLSSARGVADTRLPTFYDKKSRYSPWGGQGEHV